MLHCERNRDARSLEDTRPSKSMPSVEEESCDRERDQEANSVDNGI